MCMTPTFDPEAYRQALWAAVLRKLQEAGEQERQEQEAAHRAHLRVVE